jgi:hypothetical protein
MDQLCLFLRKQTISHHHHSPPPAEEPLRLTPRACARTVCLPASLCLSVYLSVRATRMCSESACVSPSNPPQWPPKRVHESTHLHTIDRGKTGWLYVVVSCNHVRACSRSCSSPRFSSSLCHAHHVRRNGHRRIGKENVISPTRTSLSLPCTTKRGYQMVGVTASRGQVYQKTKRSLAPKWREGSGD